MLISNERQLGNTLLQHVTPDVSLASKTSELGFVHRQLPFADVYFIVNTGNKQVSASAKFRTDKRNAEWWDPFSGNIRWTGKGPQIQLSLEPYESGVLVFTDEPRSKRAASSAHDRKRSLPAPIDLGSNWTVTFPELRKRFPVDHLLSWSDEPATRFYSGQVIYERDFSFLPKRGHEVFIDFGPGTAVDSVDQHGRFLAGIESPIREVAEVNINQQPAGWIWKPPYRLNATRLLREGQNHLQIVVYNTAMNELAGRSRADFRLLNSRYGTRFIAQDIDEIKPLPSGMLSSPRLVFDESSH